jgi:hypothetical protein
VRRVILVGNGLSIAAQPGFALGPLTAAVRVRLDAVDLDGVSARVRLEQIRDRLEADGFQDANGTGFERLIGPLDRLSLLIDVELAAIVGSIEPTLLGPLQAIGSLVRDLYVRGVGAVLSQVDSLDAAANLAPVRQVVRWFTDGLHGGDHVAVYTPNYDPLLDRILLELRTEIVGGIEHPRYVMADEFSGQDDETQLTLVPDGNAVPVFRPRTEPYQRTRPLDLIHLHGGQHWLGTPMGLFKTRLGELRAAGVYGRWTNGEVVSARPAVLLTDQKTSAVLRSPYVEGYQRLGYDLAHADRVVVLGYGFGDLPLNVRLREAHNGTRPPGSRWLINRNARATIEDAADSFAQTEDLLGAHENPPSIVLSGLPQLTIDNPDFFHP